LLPGQPDPEAVEPRELLWADFVLFLCLGVLIFIVSLVPHGIAHNALVGLLLTLTLVPICLACAPCLDRPVPLAANSEARVTPLPTLETAFPFSLPQMLRTIDAWLLWWCGAVLFGGGLLLATNLSQILQSFGASTRLLPTLVTLFSNGNFLGRLVAMLISDTLVRRGLPRPWFVVADCAVAASAQLLFLLSSTLHGAAQSFVLVVSSLLGGLAFGAIWPHLVVLTSELFGSANLATNYMFYDGTCAAVGIVVIGNLLPRAFYRPAAGATDCLGAECFAPTFAVVAALSASACVCAVVLSCRSVELYRQMGGRELPQSKQLGSDGIGMCNADSDAAPPAPADNNGDSRVRVMTVSSVRLI